MQIRAKKTLGQNFMKNKKVLEKMVEAGKIKKDDIVLEIGPGKGALTSELLKSGNKVITIEKDSRLIDLLKERFSKEISEKRFELYEGDALEIDYEKLNLVNQDFIIVANLPYYITGKFLSSTLSSDVQPKKIVLLLQKEIVERIVGVEVKQGVKKQLHKENILSVSVKVYGEPRYLMSVSRKNFTPEPRVDSAILGIYNISKEFFTNNKINEKEFFNFAKLVFGNKRKTLMKNISREYARERITDILIHLNIDKKIRGEDLNMEELKNIFLALKE